MKILLDKPEKYSVKFPLGSIGILFDT